tara:strand:+ start:503 stop:784 length:282 start_codon:yes stop_codon:yes gene_type:complete
VLLDLIVKDIGSLVAEEEERQLLDLLVEQVEKVVDLADLMPVVEMVELILVHLEAALAHKTPEVAVVLPRVKDIMAVLELSSSHIPSDKYLKT